MNVWIDILHIPQLNYYKNFIKLLDSKGVNILVTVLNRGKLAKIAIKELGIYPHVNLTVVGCHKMNRWSVIFDANLFRLVKLLFWSRNKGINVAFSNGFHHCLVAKCIRCCSYSFHDDPQARAHKFMNKYSTINHALTYVLPDDYIRPQNEVLMPTLKEWAYLAPKYFSADAEALKEYGVKPKEYIFLREVTVGTFNYADQQAGAVKGICQQIEQMREAARQQGKDMKVLFSLEEKHRRNEYPEDWILLQEPINDIHSLIYYSVGLISSGDSMAREAALLGVPSYYLGVRYDMPANLAASKVAGLHNQKTMKVEQWLANLTQSTEALEQQQEQLRKKIDTEFIDINEYMMNLVKKHDKK